MTEYNVKQAGTLRKKKIPVWVWILIGLAVFPLLLIILSVAVLLVIGVVAGSSEDGAKEAMNSPESSVRQEHVIETPDTTMEIKTDVIEETGKADSEEYDFRILSGNPR